MSEQINYPGWRVVSVLGAGSFGKVYEIERIEKYGDIENSALKHISIPPEQTDVDSYSEEYGLDYASLSQMFRKQMENITGEFSLMSKLKGNSNIVSYEDHSVIPHEDGLGWDIYIRMELLTPLTTYLREHFDNKPVDDETVIRIGSDICRALELCEKNAIIHRDIKPQNIFVSKEGNFKLGDFGIAKNSDHTTIGTRTGTFSYMAPEIYAGQPYGKTVDIYSLGMVLYWLLNERRGPFLPLPPAVPSGEDSTLALTRRLQGEDIPEPKYGSPALKQAVLRAIHFQPSMRYQSASEFYEALQDPQSVIEEAVPEGTVTLNEKGMPVVPGLPPKPGKQELPPPSILVEGVKPQKNGKKKKRWLIPVLIVGSVLLLAVALIAGIMIKQAVERKQYQKAQEEIREAERKNIPKEVLNTVWAEDNNFVKEYMVLPCESGDTELRVTPSAFGIDKEVSDDLLFLQYPDRFDQTYTFYADYVVQDGVLTVKQPQKQLLTEAATGAEPLPAEISYRLTQSSSTLRLEEEKSGQSTKYSNAVLAQDGKPVLSGAQSDPGKSYENIASIDLWFQQDMSKEAFEDKSVIMSDGSYCLKPKAQYYTNIATVSISWDKQMIPYNGRMQEENKYTFLSFHVINTYPNGFIIIEDGKYYVYQDPVPEE